MRRFYPFFIPLFCLVFLMGCKLTISTLSAPATANTGSVITLTISCTATNMEDGSSYNGVVIQIPAGWSVLYAKATSGSWSRDLTADADIAGLYAAESDQVVWAGTTGSQSFGSEGTGVSFTMKVLTGSFSGSYGQTRNYNIKAVVGANREDVWITDDPENVFDFSLVTGEKYKKSITVTKVEDITAPGPITDIVTKAIYTDQTTSVDINWDSYNEDAQGDVVAYRVYRSSINFVNVSGMNPIVEVSIGHYSHQDYTIIPGNGYYYGVTAIDELGHENPVVSTGYVYVAIPGSISGTLYKTDGVTPITGKSIRVKAYSGTCEKPVQADSTDVVTTNGKYTISRIPPGTYYLYTETSETYMDEWWASPVSVRDCTSSQTIIVDEGMDITGKNFQLDPGATILGTLYQSDGVTPLTGKSVYVYAYTGNPCGDYTSAGNTKVDTATGAYTIDGLPTGTYYLKTSSSDNYFNEWWASPKSIRDCAGAQAIDVTESQTVTGKNFQLDPGATISGTVYQSDGVTPLTGKSFSIDAYIGTPCGNYYRVEYAFINTETGTYTISRLPVGMYYLKTSASSGYTSEWWASPMSVLNCDDAQSIIVSEKQVVTNKNFQLETSRYTITASAGNGGKISPSGSVSVNKGANQVFTITPNSGYSVSGVTVDGFLVSPSIPAAGGTYTFSNIQANHSISATFKQSTVSRQQFYGVWSDGVWSWNSSTNQWTKIPSTSNALIIATGKVDSDAIEDLIGVWSYGLYVRQSTNGQWLKLSTAPTWMIAADLNNDGRDDVIGSWTGDGVYSRDSATGKWTKIALPAKQLASGNVGGKGRDDLAGVWSDGLWVRYSADASWKKLDASIPIWITTADMTGSGRSDIVGSYTTGTYYRNSATGAWTKITTPAEQLTSGDIDGDGRDDLIGIWSNTVWVRYGATGKWQQIAATKPRWITTGRLAEAVQTAGSLEDSMMLD